MAKMTDAETLARIQELRKELRELEKTALRSDWHAGFEGALRIDLHKYGNAVHLLTEEEIGEMPPRADFMVLVEDEDVAAVLDRVGASAGSDSLVDHFAALLRLVLEKNPQYFSLARRREKNMTLNSVKNIKNKLE